MTETDRIRRLYDDRAPTYDRSTGVVERIMLGAFRGEYGALLKGETIEVGVGSGLNIPFYSTDVTRAVGVDLSGAMLQLARQRSADLDIPFAFTQADAEALPFPDATFDTVAISLALCTIPDPAQSVAGAQPDLPDQRPNHNARACSLHRAATRGRAASPLAAQRTRDRLPSRPGYFRPRSVAWVLDRPTPHPALRFRRIGRRASASEDPCYPRLT